MNKMMARYLAAFALVAAVTLLLWLLRDVWTLANFALIYTLTTLIIAIWLGTAPSLAAALLSFFSFNFFLIRPYYTLAVQDPRELLDLFIFLLVAVIAGQLASYARRQAEAARLKAAEQTILYRVSGSFNQLRDRGDIATNLKQVVQEEFQAAEVTILPDKGETAGGQAADALYLLLGVGDHVYGTLRTVFHAPPSESQLRLLQSVALQAAMAWQRVELSQQAQHSQSLAEADRLKTALLRAVSHDLRTPITIIKTSASTLNTLYGRLNDEQKIEMIKTMESEADHLNTLVGNLLDMSRLQAGALVMNKDWNALSEIVDDIAARVWQLQRQERIKINLPEAMPLVYCDYGLILQALSNMVENVLRYEPAGSQVEIGGECQVGEAWLVVVNHGPTISAEEKGLIMEPFYHGRDGHVGLGLAISRGIVEAHQGRLWVEDTPGGGATFVMALPLDGKNEKSGLDPGRG
jgi:two-component system sensor histidine kinase KdpD